VTGVAACVRLSLPLKQVKTMTRATVQTITNATSIQLIDMVFPTDTNHHGTLLTGQRRHAATARFVMVAVDAQGRPTPILSALEA
jgi:acyl-CoA hydrolase